MLGLKAKTRAHFLSVRTQLQAHMHRIKCRLSCARAKPHAFSDNNIALKFRNSSAYPLTTKHRRIHTIYTILEHIHLSAPQEKEWYDRKLGARRQYNIHCEVSVGEM